MMLKRRTLFAAAAAAISPAIGLAALPAAGDRRFVFVVLRGGMDGLSAVPVPGDPAFADARGTLGRFADPTLPLGGPFALHPLLPQLHAMYTAGELTIVHATGLPYQG